MFKSYRKSNWDIYVMDSSGGQLRPLTEYPRDDLFGSWSRDGRWVHFSSGLGNNGYRLYRVSWPEGGEPVQITNAGATVSAAIARWKDTLLYEDVVQVIRRCFRSRRVEGLNNGFWRACMEALSYPTRTESSTSRKPAFLESTLFNPTSS